ncbi:glycerophosphodiester phosphodiesterase family protein [Aestuariivivens sediminis]|uniref:glycerophosphodiester phosphodiesterase family protein n=1 Tax=Aestuariivivens sediminis TaxID=2913557 RepID=UPI001F5A6E37|nr:glycerophosphodiester phosphodiesterase family protein [Aestuariivivens sediminis]
MNFKVFTYTILISTLLLVSCKDNKKSEETKNADSNSVTSIQEKIANLKDSNNNHIIVVSHRGDWRNAPENSLQAIQNCIDMGVDMVEIDIRETKDGHLVLMHDNTIDRTTNGKGLVSEWTLDSLKSLRLLDGLRVPTQHKIPTLKEALLVSKDKILINLDKSYPIFDKCYEIIKETGTQNQVVIKGSKQLSEVETEFGAYLDEVHFMPIIGLPNDNAKAIIDAYLSSKHLPIAFEFTVKHDSIKFIKEFKKIRHRGSSIWVNALWPQHNAGHDDEKAMIDPTVYDWFIEKNIDIIQTDRPQLLLDYLRSKGLHN